MKTFIQQTLEHPTPQVIKTLLGLRRLMKSQVCASGAYGVASPLARLIDNRRWQMVRAAIAGAKHAL